MIQFGMIQVNTIMELGIMLEMSMSRIKHNTMNETKDGATQNPHYRVTEVWGFLRDVLGPLSRVYSSQTQQQSNNKDASK